MITIWHGMTIQGLYCYLDMGNNTVTYHKCSHVPNLIIEGTVSQIFFLGPTSNFIQ